VAVIVRLACLVDLPCANLRSRARQAGALTFAGGKMNRIHAMCVFVWVADAESVRRGARQLDVPNALAIRAVAL